MLVVGKFKELPTIFRTIADLEGENGVANTEAVVTSLNIIVNDPPLKRPFDKATTAVNHSNVGYCTYVLNDEDTGWELAGGAVMDTTSDEIEHMMVGIATGKYDIYDLLDCTQVSDNIFNCKSIW